MGGMLWGLGQALLEGNQMDPRYGRWGATSLGEYLVPVNADAPDVTVEFVGVRDDVVNPLGVKVQPVVSTGVCKDRNHRSWPHRKHAKSSTMTPSLQGAMSMPITADGWSAGPNWEPS